MATLTPELHPPPPRPPPMAAELPPPSRPAPPSASSPAPSPSPSPSPPRVFAEVYADHVDMVWRALRSLGVSEASIEDAAQDVFLVVHRRLGDFAERSSLRTWLFGIVLRVARNHRRTERRKGSYDALDTDIADAAPGPHEEAVAAEALARVARVLGDLDEAKREVFVLGELEQLTAPEIAETLGVNVNTVYSRLRSARIAFTAALLRREGGRP